MQLWRADTGINGASSISSKVKLSLGLAADAANAPLRVKRRMPPMATVTLPEG
jgi:hypothetical protein